MSKKIIYILIIIILIITGIFVAIQMSEEKEVIQTGTNIANNTTVNTTINNNKENETIENNTIEPEVNKIENNVVEDETTTSLKPEEYAKQIVKDNWGEDDTVYYSYDGIKDGKHVVCVREKSTTKELYRYYVDVESGTFDIE